MKKFFKVYSTAFQSLTIFWPGNSSIETSGEMRARAIIFYPVVGMFMGFFLKTFHMSCEIILPEDIVIFLVIIAWVILSRACHMKDLASILITATKSFKTNPYPPAKERLSGLVAFLLMLTQLIKFLALLHVPPILITPAILTMPLTSLWAIIWSYYLLLSATGSSKSHITTWVTGRELIIASATTFAMLFFFLKLKALPGIILVMLKALILIKWFQRKNPALDERIIGASHEFGGIVFLLSLHIPLSPDF